MDETAATAAVLLIGEELLSGRTQDINLAYLGQRLAARGIRLAEARVVRDVEAEIVAAVRALSERYTYVFTTGGIGPTHDDITAVAIARAFGRNLLVDPVAEEKLKRYYGTEVLSAPRLKMATVPEGSTLIENRVSSAPGFRLDNVFVLAGVPVIMQAMFETLEDQLQAGAPIRSRTVTAPLGESRLAEGLTNVQRRFPGIGIGSYPFARDGRVAVSIVLRGTDETMLDGAAAEVAALMQQLGITADEIERG
jgi:molybdenum cofactor synthesis domain-containing protein